jgi:hypothetical protein
MRGNERWRNWQNSVTPSLVDGERLRGYSNLSLCKVRDCGAMLGWGHWVPLRDESPVPPPGVFPWPALQHAQKSHEILLLLIVEFEL